MSETPNRDRVRALMTELGWPIINAAPTWEEIFASILEALEELKRLRAAQKIDAVLETRHGKRKAAKKAKAKRK